MGKPTIAVHFVRPTLHATTKETDNMTPELEQWLRKHGTAGSHFEETRTVPGIGPGGWDSKALSNAQGQTVAPSVGHHKTVYRLYTEDVRRNATIVLVKRYFEGATLSYGIGLDSRTQSTDENAVTIEIVTSKPDAFQRVLNLAGDIRETNNQVSVLITRQDVDTFEVTERTVTHGEL
jgi:hypothetical protein